MGSGVHVYDNKDYTIKNFEIEYFANGILCCGFSDRGNNLITDNIIKNNLENGILIIE